MIEASKENINEAEKLVDSKTNEVGVFETLKPIHLSAEEIPNAMSDIILEANRLNDREGYIQMEAAFLLKTVPTTFVKFEVEGKKEDFASILKQKIETIIQEKNLTGPQDLEFLTTTFQVVAPEEAEKPKNERTLKSSLYQNLISTY